MATVVSGRPVASPRTGAPVPRPRASARRPNRSGTVVLLIGALYCLMPVVWVLMASTKSANELFSTLTFVPSTHLWDNIRQLSAYRGGLYWRWMANTALYAGVGALASSGTSAINGTSGRSPSRLTAVPDPVGGPILA